MRALGSLDSFGHTLGSVHWGCSGTRWFHWGSLGSFGRPLGVILARTWCRRVHSGPLGSFGRGLPVFGFISETFCGSLGVVSCASGVVGFIWGRLVNSGAPGWSFSLFRGALGVVAFTSFGSFGCALEVVRFIWVGWFHTRALGMVGFIQARPVGCRQHLGGGGGCRGSLRSFGGDLGFAGFWVDSGAAWGSSG